MSELTDFEKEAKADIREAQKATAAEKGSYKECKIRGYELPAAEIPATDSTRSCFNCRLQNITIHKWVYFDANRKTPEATNYS